MAEINWADLRAEYVTTGISYRQLSDKYNIPYSTIRHRGKREGWYKDKTQRGREIGAEKVEIAAKSEIIKYERMNEVACKAFNRIEKLIDICLDAQSMRALVASLKDIKSMVGLRTDAEAREQEARINKLIKDAEKGEDDTPTAIAITINGAGEGWTE